MSDRSRERERMVERQISSRGIHDRRVLDAMTRVPREQFVPAELAGEALADRALPIGDGVTISQPYIVALMSELAHVQPGARVLEIGTGSGYQAAVLAELGAEVYSIERIEAHHERAKQRLQAAGYGDRVQLRYGDGFAGWPEAAPFSAILLTAAPEEIPAALLDQLGEGGRLIAPVGAAWVQSLVVIERTADGFERQHVSDVMFVPMLAGVR
jgi:protein-L-isoaspartate(D-aspartate) O-methyltransferase